MRIYGSIFVSYLSPRVFLNKIRKYLTYFFLLLEGSGVATLLCMAWGATDSIPWTFIEV